MLSVNYTSITILIFVLCCILILFNAKYDSSLTVSTWALTFGLHPSSSTQSLKNGSDLFNNKSKKNFRGSVYLQSKTASNSSNNTSFKRGDILGSASFTNIAGNISSKLEGAYNGTILRKSDKYVCCKTMSTSQGRRVTFLVVEHVRITFERGNIILWVSEESLNRVTNEVKRCQITGYVKRPPSIRVKVDAFTTCAYRNDTILVDSEFWGSYYHTTTDHIVPWFITSQVLHMHEPSVQFYATDGWKLPSSRVEKHLQRFAACLGVHVRPRVHVDSGCYRRLSIGYMYTFRPVLWPHVKMEDLVFIPELAPWFRMAHEKLYACYASPSEQIPWLFVRRSDGAEERHVHVEKTYKSVMYVERKDNEPIPWSSVHGLLAVEGATFANQWLMPKNSTLLQLHVPRSGTSLPTIWHTSLAMYLGNSAIDVVLEQNVLSVDVLNSLINASLFVTPGRRCISRGARVPFDCVV